MEIKIGQTFPVFALPDAKGVIHHLSDYLGKYVVLYVYPKDDTPGCTKEACDFRDSQNLKAAGAVILGISQDDAQSHERFAQKYDLPFSLLTDQEDYLQSIGAYGTKNMYGKVTQGIKRQTFLIDPQGNLVKAWRAVKVDGHADAVSKALQEHQEAQQ